MTPLELRQKINQQLETLLPEQLALVSAFLDTLQPIQKKPPLRKLTPIKRGKETINLDIKPPSDPKARIRATLAQLKTNPRSPVPPKRSTSKLGNLSQFSGTWLGDDLEECQEFVRSTRLPSEF
ncbi:MAG TPA: hypothetical protein DCY91_04780 [Cyanobacteria bacterium UBA11370]|nr:hypothetical protein [Cyanobacteria bacterium UBA11370]HBY77507.1 hypothetical protein [Cyanobacteria bacterium UBA11148]